MPKSGEVSSELLLEHRSLGQLLLQRSCSRLLFSNLLQKCRDRCRHEALELSERRIDVLDTRERCGGSRLALQQARLQRRDATINLRLTLGSRCLNQGS